MATGYGNLVRNGYGELKNNDNFSALTYSTTAPLPQGAVGSFDTPAPGGLALTIQSDDFIEIDATKQYEISCSLINTDATSVANADDGYAYFGLACYDKFKNLIQPVHVNEKEGTRTILTAPLNPGDTTITVRSTANWEIPKSPAEDHRCSIIFWNYIDPSGQKWLPGTYSRNGIYGAANSPAYTSISGSVISLSTSYTGPAIPAGTVLSNTHSGGSYLYRWFGKVPGTWTKVSGYVSGYARGTAPGDKFWSGTHYVKMLFLLNRNKVGTNTAAGSSTARMRVANVEMVHPSITASVNYDYQGGVVSVVGRNLVGDTVDVYRYDTETRQRQLLRGGLDYEVRAGGTIVILDPEIPFNQDVIYEVEMFPNGKTDLENNPPVIIKSEPQHIYAMDHYGHMGLKCSPVYLCDPLIPAFGRWFGLLAIDPLSYPPRSQLFDVLGRHAPVAVSQVRSEARTTIHLYTDTLQDRHELLRMLASGRILLLRNPDPRYPESSWYVAVQEVTESRIVPDHRDPRRRFSLEIAVVQRPVGYLAFVKSSRTYNTYKRFEPDGATPITPAAYFGSLQDYGDYLDVLLGGIPGAARPMAVTQPPPPPPPQNDEDVVIPDFIYVSGVGPVGPDMSDDGTTPDEDIAAIEAPPPPPAPIAVTDEELLAAARLVRGKYPTASAARTSWSLQ